MIYNMYNYIYIIKYMYIYIDISVYIRYILIYYIIYIQIYIYIYHYDIHYLPTDISQTQMSSPSLLVATRCSQMPKSFRATPASPLWPHQPPDGDFLDPTRPGQRRNQKPMGKIHHFFIGKSIISMAIIMGVNTSYY